MSQFPVIAAGTDLTAQVLNWMLPLTAIKPADTSRASTVTLTADPDLAVPVEASATYLLDCHLFYQGGTQGSSDLQSGWTVPTGAAMAWDATRYSLTGSFGNLSGLTAASTESAGSNGAGATRSVHIKGTVTTGSTAGTLSLTWAQSTSSATATIVQASSSLTLRRTA